MADPMHHLIRQLNHQVSLLEHENQSLKLQVVQLQVLLNRCLRIIEALFRPSSR